MESLSKQFQRQAVDFPRCVEAQRPLLRRRRVSDAANGGEPAHPGYNPGAGEGWLSPPLRVPPETHAQRSLVEVVAEARQLAGPLALDLDRTGRPPPCAGHRPAYQRRERHACGGGLGPPVGGLARREANGHQDRRRLAIATRRHRWGVRGGAAPRQPPPGTRKAWPQGVCWLAGSRISGQYRPPERRIRRRRNRHDVKSGDRFGRCRWAAGSPESPSVATGKPARSS